MNVMRILNLKILSKTACIVVTSNGLVMFQNVWRSRRRAVRRTKKRKKKMKVRIEIPSNQFAMNGCEIINFQVFDEFER